MRKTETGSKLRRNRGTKAVVREDGAQTRRQLLECAGQVFAEQGYARATSKEICRRAKANIAAVNYHFGSKDGLYAAVLEEAHARLVSVDAVAAVMEGAGDPRAKLQAFLTRILGEIARRDAGAWELRLLSREVLAPTPMIGSMLTNQVAPKAKLVGGMIGGALGVPVSHPAVARTLLSIMGPCVMLLIVNREVLSRIFPSLGTDPQALIEHLVTFALAGMKAIAAQERKR